MLINLAFIKAVNGLFYFAMDYLAELEEEVSAVLVRSPVIATAVRQRFPSTTVVIVGPRQAALTVWATARRGEMVFTPSPHPIPWCSRQMVVVHDTFPFEGRVGAFKAALFFLSMRTSGAKAGYINESDARTFLLKGGLDTARMLPSPNRMAFSSAAAPKEKIVLSDQPVIGLFGTDSSKKNYEQLFAEVAARAPRTRLKFRIYGQWNNYIANIISRFPDLDIGLISSSDIGIEQFLRSLDLVASAAMREGFSRPTALALSLGIPCWIVDAPVFKEFYGEAAAFHRSIGSLGGALAALGQGVVLERPAFALPDMLEQNFQRCAAWLRGEDTRRV